VFAKAATEIKAAIRGALGQAKKVVVCDLDNTLWGGVAADDDRIRLGSPDPLGECYADVQRALKALRQRGVLLAICSKNDEQFALSVVDEHPGMVLNRRDFVSWRINWEDKAANLPSLAQELNLGLDSFVFLDDSPEERDQVRRLHPQVAVPDLPPSATDYGAFIRSLPYFETLSLDQEDYARTDMYRAERARAEIRDMSGDLESWLRTLELTLTAARLAPDSLPRATQLLNKTNQFNLSTRRLDAQTFWEWSNAAGNTTFVFHVKDKFGDFGLTALASLSRTDERAGRIQDFVMSCRVMGKRVEHAILAFLLRRAKALGLAFLTAPATATPRNRPVRDFFDGTYVQDGTSQIDPDAVSMPAAIRIIEGD
jgi:FkbH-like protein